MLAACVNGRITDVQPCQRRRHLRQAPRAADMNQIAATCTTPVRASEPFCGHSPHQARETALKADGPMLQGDLRHFERNTDIVGPDPAASLACAQANRRQRGHQGAGRGLSRIDVLGVDHDHVTGRNLGPVTATVEVESSRRRDEQPAVIVFDIE